MKGVLLILLFSVATAASAQPPGADLAVTQTAPLDFSYNTVEDLSATKTLANALQVKLKAINRGMSVYASVDVNGVDKKALNNILIMRLSNSTSPDVNIAGSEIALTHTPVLLFFQPGTRGNVHNFSYSYDLILNPFTTFVTVGHFNYNIVFTMTKQ